MRGSKDTPGMPDGKSHRAFICFEIVSQNQRLEMELQFDLNFYLSETWLVCTSIFGMRFEHIFSLAFLSSSSVVAFRGPNSDRRNGECFATSRQASEIIAPEAAHSHAASLSIRPNASSDGERCMKDAVHPIVHLSVHLRIFGRVRRTRSCAWNDDQFGRGQNTGLGWSDPTFVHVSVPKVIRGVAPAQLRGDRAEYFVRAAFRSRRPQ
jgi:hypothetical protein